LYIGTPGVYTAKLLNSEANDALNNKIIIEEESIENCRNLRQIPWWRITLLLSLPVVCQSISRSLVVIK